MVRHDEKFVELIQCEMFVEYGHDVKFFRVISWQNVHRVGS